MIALEIKLNGKRVCVAGAEDLTVLGAHIIAYGKLGKRSVPRKPDEPAEITYSVGGLVPKPKGKDTYPKWKDAAPLQIGDVLEIKVLETKKADPIKRRKAMPKKLK